MPSTILFAQVKRESEEPLPLAPLPQLRERMDDNPFESAETCCGISFIKPSKLSMLSIQNILYPMIRDDHLIPKGLVVLPCSISVHFHTVSGWLATEDGGALPTLNPGEPSFNNPGFVSQFPPLPVVAKLLVEVYHANGGDEFLHGSKVALI